MALIVTLGILTVIAMAVVAFVITLRLERLAARNTLDRAAARQYVDVGLAQAMSTVDAALAGRVFPTRDWIATNSIDAIVPPVRYSAPCNSNVQLNTRIGTECSNLFQEGDCLGTPSTNVLDTIRLFRGAVTNFVPTALAEQATQVRSGWSDISNTVYTIGSDGVAIPNSVRGGRVSFLVVNMSGLMDAHFLTKTREKALGEAALNQKAWDLIAMATTTCSRVFLSQPDLTSANGGNPVSNLVTLSYDPDPDFFFAPTNPAAWLGTRAFATNLVTRFDVNTLTNDANLDLNLATVSNLLADAGVSNTPAVAYNIYNYLTPDRIPKPANIAFYRTDYGVKDVPLINEVTLQDVSATGTSNHYGVAVELWYPFVPHDSPDKVTLRVDVYTNLTSFDIKTAETSPLPAQNSFSFQYDALDRMTYATPTEFCIGSTTNKGKQPVFFEEIVSLSAAVQQTNYWAVSANHPIWVWPRVFVDGTCVDEALVNVADTCPLYTWTGTGSWQYADLRANSTTNSAVFTLADTLGTTNVNCTVHPPIMLMDAPMTSAGELRHIYAPGMTNDCLDLASPQGAACRDRFTVRTTNAPMRGLVQANTPYTNVWKALLSDIELGWTNSVTATLTNVADQSDADQNCLAALVANALSNTTGRGWIRYQEMLPDIASNIESAVGTDAFLSEPGAVSERGDLLAGIADRVSFRQNVFLVIVDAQRLSPLGAPPAGRILADQRAAAVVIRDAFTGRWVVNSLVWLTE